MERDPYNKVLLIKWSQIPHWEQLDFVKVLPDEIKEKLRRMPAEAEPKYEGWDPVTQKPRLVLDPENSRAYWLKYYHEKYEPIREKGANLTILEAQAQTSANLMRGVAHISELLERMNQHMLRVATSTDEVLSICQQITEDRLP